MLLPARLVQLMVRQAMLNALIDRLAFLLYERIAQRGSRSKYAVDDAQWVCVARRLFPNGVEEQTLQDAQGRQATRLLKPKAL